MILTVDANGRRDGFGYPPFIRRQAREIDKRFGLWIKNINIIPFGEDPDAPLIIPFKSANPCVGKGRPAIGPGLKYLEPLAIEPAQAIAGCRPDKTLPILYNIGYVRLGLALPVGDAFGLR